MKVLKLRNYDKTAVIPGTGELPFSVPEDTVGPGGKGGWRDGIS
jgi:hypothetical protein